MSLERSVSVLMYAVTIYSRMQFLQQLRIVIIIYPKGQFIKFAHLVFVFLFLRFVSFYFIMNRRTAITTHTTCVIFCKFICDLFCIYFFLCPVSFRLLCHLRVLCCINFFCLCHTYCPIIVFYGC